MFGSKLRSWMENHIVRPRKKGSKNKTGSSGTNFGVLTAQNGYKSGTFAGGESMVGSPARRSEVSPIQSHATSRRGWHSPNQDSIPISPKSDHYPMQHRLPNGHTNGGDAQYWTNTYGPVNRTDHPSSYQQQQQPQHYSVLSSPRSISRNASSYTLEFAPPNVYYSKSVDSFAASDATMPYAMPEFEYRTAESNGPSSLLSAGTVASVSSGNNGHHHIAHANYSTATSSSNELLEELHPLDGGTRIKRLHPATARINSFTVNHHQHNASNNNNNHVANGAIGGHYGPSQRGSQSAAMDGGGESKYGKLLQQPPIGGSALVATSSPPYGGSIYYDHPQHNGINNNLVHQSTHQAYANGAGTTPVGHSKTTSAPAAAPHVPRTTKLDANSSRIVNGNNNNNNHHFEVPAGTTGRGSQHHHQPGSSFTATFASKFHKLTGSRSNAHESAVNGGSGSGASSGKLNHVNNNNNGSMVASGNGGDSASNAPYQQHQINNATTHLHPLQALTALSGKLPHPAPPLSSSSSPPPPVQGAPTHLHHTSAHGGHHHHHPHGHPMGHALSSPESAYSTGYSTDGTSPGGCSYTPEYYINIRTGTHYFPKAASAHHGRGPPGSGCIERTGPAVVGASGGHENGAKFKCALNRIEEKHVEFCIEQEKHASPRRGSASNQSNTKPTVPEPATNGACVLSQPQQQQPKQQTVSTTSSQPQATAQPSLSQPTTAQSPPNAVAMSPIMQKNLGMQHYRSIESPSPRQRCRIRTNPWLTTADGALASNCLKRTEQDSGSTSSGIKSSSGTDDNKNDHKQTIANSDTDSSSSTEKVVNKRILTPRSLRKIGDISRLDSKAAASVTFGSNQESDEDATLNEMMGKFDESYHYEKETDILSCSDSDPTDCPTDIDTGQDAGDECDTDDLLDLDFIDTGSVQEVADKETYRHTASCSIHSFPEGKAPNKQRMSRNRRTNESGSGSKRRKKLVRTRKKPSENAALDTGTSRDSSGLVSRGCRSLGGTPMSLRRNQQDTECRTPARSSPLTNRSNSLTFTEVHSLHSRILAISESEKALLKADLEADVKYKQLIHEAESILFSMKSNSSICLKELVTAPPPVPPRDPQPPAIPPKEVPPTTISSPRRVCNPPANKRVEMLRNCEADLRRELAKTCSQKCSDGTPGREGELNPAEGVIVNKRLEVLRYETSPWSLSAPNSPKNTRVLLPRKTPVSNFVQHQPQQTVIQGGSCTPETLATDLKYCANLSSPPPPPPRLLSKSPTIVRRRFRSQSPHLNIESDSDSDDVSRNLDYKAKDGKGRNGNKENHLHQQPAPANAGSGIVNGSVCKGVTGKQMNNFRHTIHGPGSAVANGDETAGTELMIIDGEMRPVKGMHKSPLISFRSVDIGSPVTDDYCPQSEPLKRKIYTCSAAFERIQRTLDQDPERVSLLRRERQNKSPRPSCIASPAKTQTFTKQQLIMDTLADIKNCLADQSLKLNELNESDN